MGKSTFISVLSAIAVLACLAITYRATHDKNAALNDSETAAEKVARLESEVALLKQQRDRFQVDVESPEPEVIPTETVHEIPTAEDHSDGLIERIGQLKRMLVLYPELGMPEFSFAKDEDWGRAAGIMREDSDFETRRAFSLLRQAAVWQFRPIFLEARRQYREDHGGAEPSDPSLLRPYAPDPVIAQIFDDYRPSETTSMGTKWLFERVLTDDEWFSQTIYFGAEDNAYGMVSPGAGAAIRNARSRFIAENGREPMDAAELVLMFRYPPDLEVLENLWDKAPEGED